MPGSIPELSLKERVLLWLAVVDEQGGHGSIAPTQAGISQMTALSRGHVSRTVTPLVADGFLREERARVTGFSRALKAYAVTEKGRAEYGRLSATLLAATVPVRGGDAALSHRRLAEVLPRPDAAALWQAWESLRTTGHLLSGGAVAATAPIRPRFLLDDLEAPPRPRAFVGRERELQAVRGFVAGDAALLVVEAPGGFGKSSLVATALAEGIGNRHLLWLRVADAMTADRLLERIAVFARDTGRAVPPPPGADAEATQAYLQRALKGLPCLIVLDDVQKAAPVTAQLVAVLVRLASRFPTMKVILTGRSVTLPGERIPQDARLPLGALAETASERLLELRGVPRTERPRVAAAAQGVPLFLELLAERALTSRGGAAVPYERVVADLTAGLQPAHLEVASWASAIRVPFGSGFLASLGVGSEAAVDGLVAAGLIARRADGRLEMHDVVREAFSVRLEHRERQRVHSRLAEAYRPARAWDRDERAGAAVTEFLHHLVAAGRREEAVRWVLRNQSRIIHAAPRLFAEGPRTA